MKKSIRIIVDNIVSERWVLELLDYLDNHYEVIIEVNKPSIVNRNQYGFITKLLIKFECFFSTNIKNEYFNQVDLSNYVNKKTYSIDCIIINMSSLKIEGGIEIKHKNMIVNLNNYEKLLYIKTGSEIELITTRRSNDSVKQIKSYITSNNSLFLSTRKSNLVAAISDLIYYSILAENHAIKFEIKSDKTPKINLLNYLMTYPVKVISIKIQSSKASLKWHICYMSPDKKITTFKLPIGEFWADPFIYNQNDKLEIFFERMKRNSSKGIISSYKIVDGTYRDLLTEKYHLSFPFTINIGGNYYVIPESKQNKNINLYIYDNKTNQLKYIKAIIQNIEAVDTTILEYNNILWLFCTVKSTPLSNSGDVLMIYYSSEITGEWNPHSKNPIKMSNSSSRGAGNFFYKDDYWNRPVQNCSKQYGGSVKIMKIVQLTKHLYEEVEKEEIHPKSFNKKAKALHTYSYIKGHVAVDLQINTNYVSKAESSTNSSK
jgi:hypothetical protein